MEQTLRSRVIGTFTYDKLTNDYTAETPGERGTVYWSLKLSEDGADAAVLLERADRLYEELSRFDAMARAAIAAELTEYKNDFWPEYDEDDENLDWDAVDAGVYAVSEARFAEAIRLLDIELRSGRLYCEYEDGELFGGHRIHAYFDENYKLVSADV
ncbi:DUF2262 domain-containing protein [Paenibacillus sp. CN-4]|uniref:DUF2262 domain-containing protein n=1 Tax=Paenibacillus nanchangensis TaxID=3348343 RepID=UPI00397E1918